MPEPRIRILELGERKAVFVLENVNPSIANALRRTLLGGIPKLAIHEVHFLKGRVKDSRGNEFEAVAPLYDEIIAHRMAMIPLPHDPTMKPWKECETDDVTKAGDECVVVYYVEKAGPGIVWSRDLRPINRPSDFAPVDPDIPIVKLAKGQGIMAYAYAVVGYGRDHAKWQATHGVGYKYYPVIEVDQGKCDLCGDCVQACPRKILKIEGESLVVTDEKSCILCDACVEACGRGAISVRGDETRFIFRFETDGSMTAAQALRYALKELIEGFDKLRKEASLR